MSAELELAVTSEIVDEICRRSADGEGVEAIIKDMKLPSGTMVWLRDKHIGRIVDAKKEQLRRKAIKEKVEREKKDGMGNT